MKESVTFHCAFEDTEGWYIDSVEFTEEKAIEEAVARNVAERDRLKKSKGKPDAVWVVVQANTTYNVVARPMPPTKPRKVVRRRQPIK